MSKTVEEIVEVIESVLDSSDRVEIDESDAQISGILEDLHKAKIRRPLSEAGYCVDFPASGTVLTIFRIGPSQAPNPKAKSKVKEKKAKAPQVQPELGEGQHSYVEPKCMASIKNVLAYKKSLISYFVGPTQCGKSAAARHLAELFGLVLYETNCKRDMGSSSLFGDHTVKVDPVVKQSVMTWQDGIIVKAALEGLDENGNEVGPAALLFLDEIPAVGPDVGHSLNRFFESTDPRRTLIIDDDGGRVIRAHSGLKIILAGNVVGRGTNTLNDQAYAAQQDALDLSLLKRVAAFYRFGYDRKVEQKILKEKIGNDKVAQQIIQFRDGIRKLIKAGKLSTPFTTGDIVQISDLYQVFGDLGEALYRTVFELALPEERSKYNETATAVLPGRDLVSEFEEKGVDYM